MDRLISLQAAIDVVTKHYRAFDNDLLELIVYEMKRLPSAQPELPDWVQKVEKYRKSAPSHIHNPLAWALYQTWKEFDR